MATQGGVDVSTYDPLRAFKFVVEITGLVAGLGFQKVSGLKYGSDVVEYREGNVPIHKRKLPGLTTYEPITLTKGAGPSSAAGGLINWKHQVAGYGKGQEYHDGVVTGDPISDSGTTGFRRRVDINVLDKGINARNGGGTARHYIVHRAWPSELSISDLNAEASEVLIETLVLQHEGLENENIGYGG